MFFTIVLLLTAVSSVAYEKTEKMQTGSIKRSEIKVNNEVKKKTKTSGKTKWIAFFGVDSRDNNLGKGSRSDCIMVAKVSENGEVKLLSVYRDTFLDIGGSYAKCNAAYAFDGAEGAISMLNQNLDLNITDYVTVDWAAVSTAIDLLGGIEIDVQEEELSDLNKYISETAKEADKSAEKVEKAGKQLLSGVQATTYARIRHTEGGDFKRAERQRVVLEEMLKKAKSVNLGTLNAIVDDVLPMIRTSFTEKEILSFAKDYNSYKITAMDGFPFTKTTATINPYGSIVIPTDLSSNVKKLHEFFGDKDYEISSDVSNRSARIQALTGR